MPDPAAYVSAVATNNNEAGSATQVTRYSGPNHDGGDRSSPYGLSRLAPAMKLTDVAGEIERADEMIGQTTSSKLRVIAEQIRHLQRQAEEILTSAKKDLDLHRASCAFPRRIGHSYHLYQRHDGSLYWSMLSAEEWGASPPHEYVGSYRLEPDRSWTPLHDIDENNDVDPFAGEEIVRKLLPGA